MSQPFREAFEGWAVRRADGQFYRESGQVVIWGVDNLVLGEGEALVRVRETIEEIAPEGDGLKPTGKGKP